MVLKPQAFHTKRLTPDFIHPGHYLVPFLVTISEPGHQKRHPGIRFAYSI